MNNWIFITSNQGLSAFFKVHKFLRRSLSTSWALQPHCDFSGPLFYKSCPNCANYFYRSIKNWERTSQLFHDFQKKLRSFKLKTIKCFKFHNFFLQAEYPKNQKHLPLQIQKLTYHTIIVTSLFLISKVQKRHEAMWEVSEPLHTCIGFLHTCVLVSRQAFSLHVTISSFQMPRRRHKGTCLQIVVIQDVLPNDYR